eukprot:SAG31_NODE_13_length_37961_cov_21.751307_35_plen_75_part_00
MGLSGVLDIIHPVSGHLPLPFNDGNSDVPSGIASYASIKWASACQLETKCVRWWLAMFGLVLRSYFSCTRARAA